ncbi:hypothetical protein LTS10_002670 [Elasticomyces elasticus]|nr:hypothetical protein LTS10_002670 [Elasticomyces elasticus]
MATAQEQGLGVAEILEAILLQLPPHDLLFAQKVCKDWKQAIEASPSIQKALFFMPGTKDDVHPGYVTANCLLKSFNTDEAVAPNPFLMVYNKFNAGSWIATHRTRVSLLHVSEEASCHRMFITQPPTKTSITSRVDTREGPAWADMYSPIFLEPMEGDRFGTLVKGFWECTVNVELDQYRWYGGEVSLVNSDPLGQQG